MAQAPRRSIVAQPLDALAYVQAPIGWAPDLPPMEAGNYAMVLDNFIPKPGRITSRNAMFSGVGNWDANYATISALGLAQGQPFSVRGSFVVPAVNGPIVVCGLIPTQIHQFTTDEALWIDGVSASTLITSPSQQQAVLGQGVPWSGTPANQASSTDPVYTTKYVVPGKSYTSMYGVTWGVSLPVGYFSNQFVAAQAVHGINRLLYYNNSTGALSTVYNGSGGSDTPTGVTAVKAYQSRLWALGGIVGNDGGAPNAGSWDSYSSTALYYTVPVTPFAPTAPSALGNWQDPVSGLVNVIYVEPNENDPGMGLASFNNRLIIFRRNSIYVLTGQTNANYTVTLLSRNYGCVDQESIIETDHGVYFMDDTGLCLTTGTSCANVSGAARDTLAAAVGFYAQVGGGDITAAQLNDDSLIISIRVGSQSSFAPVTIWSGIFSPDTGSWWRLTSLLWSAGDSNPDWPNNNTSSDGLPSRILGGKNRGVSKVSTIGSYRVVDIEPSFSVATGIELIHSISDDAIGGRTTIIEEGYNIGEPVLGAIANYIAAPNVGFYGVGSWTSAATQIITNSGANRNQQVTGGPGVIKYAGYLAIGTLGTIGQGAEVNIGTPPAGTWKLNYYSNNSAACQVVIGPHAASPAQQLTAQAADSGWTNHTITFTSDGITNYYVGFRSATAITTTFEIAKVCVNASGTYEDGDIFGFGWSAQPGASTTQVVTTPALSAFIPIPLRWMSGFVPLTDAGRFYTSGVRWWCDYLYTVNPVSTLPALPLQLIDNNGAVISALGQPGSNVTTATRALPSQTSAPLSVRDRQNMQWPMVQRATQDMPGEIQHLQVLYDWTTTGIPLDASEHWLYDIYGVGIEYQQGRNLRTT